jgi:hypothetical protein
MTILLQSKVRYVGAILVAAGKADESWQDCPRLFLSAFRATAYELLLPPSFKSLISTAVERTKTQLDHYHTQHLYNRFGGRFQGKSGVDRVFFAPALDSERLRVSI